MALRVGQVELHLAVRDVMAAVALKAGRGGLGVSVAARLKQMVDTLTYLRSSKCS